MPVMLSGDGLNLYYNIVRHFTTLDLEMKRMRDWNNSEEKNEKILGKWK